MFKRGLLRRGRIYSDQGYSVGITDRTHLEYREGRRVMSVPGELGTNGFVLYTDTMNAWDDLLKVDDIKKREIIQRIKEALESQGMVLDVVQST